MNNQHESTYTLLVRSEEKNRGIVETMIYALLGLSVIVSIYQFAQESNSLPIDKVTWESYSAPHMSRQPVETGSHRGS